ncbi:hypothetical protein TU70_09295 [Bacillus mycoides]|nr:hypothetical protein TU70_09295 [Bacillus mycoides]
MIGSLFKSCIVIGEYLTLTFNKEQFEELLNSVNFNPQCYEGKYRSRNHILLRAAEEVMPDMDLEDIEKTYTNII